MGESGGRCLVLPESCFGTIPVLCDTVPKPCFVFIVVWGHQVRSKSCRSDGKARVDTAGLGPRSVSLFLYGTNAVFCHVTIP